MALNAVMTATTRQTTAQRMGPRMVMMTNLIAKPLGELREAVKKEIETNPAIDDVDYSPFFRRGVSSSSSDVNTMLENMAARSESLDEHLMSALRLAEVDPKMRSIAEFIIGDLDENGRFAGSVPDLMMITGASAEEIERARQFVMTLDPLGCGAMTTEECLTAQLVTIPAKDREACSRVIARIDDIRNGRADIADIGAEALATFRKYRGRLKANPAEKFAHKRAEIVTPDIIVDRKGEVSVETGDIPEIRISAKYLQMSKDRSLDEETRHYAQERVRHARDFAAALERRQDAMVKIAELTVGAQSKYLAEGERGLKPLTMTKVAKAVKCSVATVSRAAHRKFVKTPRGVLPLRKFFSQVDGAMLAKLRELVAAMPKASDRELSEAMSEAGFNLARRTINKYRRMLSKR